MKRFSKLERARGGDETEDGIAPSASAKRFEAIEKARESSAASSASPFRPPPDANAPVQLELHDRYTEQVEEARRHRQKRATEDLTDLALQRLERAKPHRAPDVLDTIALGLAFGPLAAQSPERRLWVLGATLVAIWFGVGLAVSTAAGIITSALLVGALVIVGMARSRPT